MKEITAKEAKKIAMDYSNNALKLDAIFEKAFKHINELAQEGYFATEIRIPLESFGFEEGVSLSTAKLVYEHFKGLGYTCSNWEVSCYFYFTICWDV